MKERSAVYITTTIPYVNAEPHVGFALEVVQADVLARHFRLLGHPVFFSTGADEHGQKIWQKAIDAGQDVSSYVDIFAAKFADLKEALDLSNDNFIRTTDPKHIEAAQEFWRRCAEKGDIYKKSYKGEYCVGCEKFVTERDLNENRECPDHPGKELAFIEEKNYFFKLSNYREKLLAYLKGDNTIFPDYRKQDAIRFVESGLEDFSISRVKEKMSWGVPVQDDPEHVFYVWFDALVNYISTLGWPSDSEGQFQRFWVDGRTLQFAGKDQIRFQSIMWQGMLMSAGLPNTDSIIYHGFLTSGGQKMSKTLGNVISPFELVEEFGTDAVRYFLLREVTPYEDSDITRERFQEAYNANLVNGLGNLVSRILKMSETYNVEKSTSKEGAVASASGSELEKSVVESLDRYALNEAMDTIWKEIARLDKVIQEEEPFKVWKIDEEGARKIVRELVADLSDITLLLRPFLPQTAEKIEECIRENKKPTNPLFLRKE